MSAGTPRSPTIDGLRPDRVYTISAYVQPWIGPLPVSMWFAGGDALVRGTQQTPIATPDATASLRRWYRLSMTLRTSKSFSGTGELRLGYAAGDVALVYSAHQPDAADGFWTAASGPAGVHRGVWSAATTYTHGESAEYPAGRYWTAVVDQGPQGTTGPAEFRVDRILVEEGARLQPYFDGDFDSLDYLWEGDNGNSRSHYYRGLAANQYRLERVLRELTPLNGRARIIYAAAP